jgi:hypothetical protein
LRRALETRLGHFSGKSSNRHPPTPSRKDGAAAWCVLDGLSWVLFKLNRPRVALDYVLKAIENFGTQSKSLIARREPDIGVNDGRS